MDIYFCDLCGVRVTDVDLRGGHGIRRVDDVICATCLELGHGKEWLVQHNRVRQSSSTSIPPVVKSKAPGTATAALPGKAAVPRSAAKESPIVDAGRDRARTVEEDEPEVAPVAPRIIGDIDGIATAATVPDHEAEAAVHEHAAQPERRPAKARGSDFAAAASGFSALGTPPAAPARHGADDLGDDSGGNRELTAEEAEHLIAEEAQVDHQAGLETADGRDERRAAEVAETTDGEAPGASDAAGLSREAQEAATDENDPADEAALKIGGPSAARRPAGRPGNARPGGSSASSTRTPAGRPSTGRIAAGGAQGRSGAKPAASSAKNGRAGNSSTKNAAAKTGKGAKSSVRAKARNDNNKKVLIFSGISISILVAIMIGVTVNRNNRHPTQKTETVNISKELIEHIKSGITQASKALSSQDVKQLETSRSAIDAVVAEADAYSKFAGDHGRSEEEIGQALQDAKLPALKSLKVDIGHKLVELSQH